MNLLEAKQLKKYSIVRMQDELAQYCDYTSPYYNCFNKDWLVIDLFGDLSSTPIFSLQTFTLKEQSFIPIEFLYFTGKQANKLKVKLKNLIMKTITLTLLVSSLIACGGNPHIHSAINEERMESGSLTQGSKAWREANVCHSNVKNGLCLRLVDGPFVLTQLRTSDTCSKAMMVGIKDTYNNPNEFTHPRWEMGAAEHHPLVLHNVEIQIKQGESLFLGTFDYSMASANSYCYVNWVGYRLGNK